MIVSQHGLLYNERLILKQDIYMKESEFSSNLDELIQGATQKENYLKSFSNTSYQEQKLISQMKTHQHLL